MTDVASVIVRWSRLANRDQDQDAPTFSVHEVGLLVERIGTLIVVVRAMHDLETAFRLHIKYMPRAIREQLTPPLKALRRAIDIAAP